MDSVQDSHRAKVEAILDSRADYKSLQVIVNKWGSELHCVCHVHIVYDETGTLLEHITSWLPLPDPTPPPMILQIPNSSESARGEETAEVMPAAGDTEYNNRH